jgi:hypothetical protein
MSQTEQHPADPMANSITFPERNKLAGCAATANKPQIVRRLHQGDFKNASVRTWFALVLMGLICSSTPTAAQLNSPQVGWQAELSKKFHHVSGTVTVLDQNTIQVDDFTFDGGGIDVYFYLGRENTKSAFQSGLPIGDQLLSRVFDGSGPPLVIDLPPHQTLEGWNAISVWCVTAAVSFGDGTFAPVGSPLAGDFNDDGSVDAADYVAWRNGLGGEYNATDYDEWRASFGTNSAATSAPNPGAFPMNLVPEPLTMPLFAVASVLGLHWARGQIRRRKSRT